MVKSSPEPATIQRLSYSAVALDRYKPCKSISLSINHSLRIVLCCFLAHVSDAFDKNCVWGASLLALPMRIRQQAPEVHDMSVVEYAASVSMTYKYRLFLR